MTARDLRAAVAVLAVSFAALAWLLVSGAGGIGADPDRERGAADLPRPPRSVGLRPAGRDLPAQDVPGVDDAVDAPDEFVPAPRAVGLVLSAQDGTPVAGARILPEGRARPTHDRDVAESDEHGRFEVRGVPSDAFERLRVVANGYLAASVPVVDEEIVVRLERGLSIEGHVRDDAGAPVAFARVFATAVENRTSWPRSPSWFDAWSVGGSTECAEDGSFALSGLPEGTVELCAAADLHGVACESIDASRTRYVRLVLVPFAEISVSIVDARSGSPVPSFGAFGRPDAGESHVERPLDLLANGVDRGRHPPGAFVTRVRRSGDPSATGGSYPLRAFAVGYGSAEAVIPFAYGKRTSARVPLEPVGSGWRTVALRAEFEGGAPFSGALGGTVKSTSDGGGGPVGTRIDFVDGVGSIRLPVGAHFLGASGAGSAGVFWPRPLERSVRVEVTDEAEGVTVIPLRGSILELTVLDATGARRRGYDLWIESDLGHGRTSGSRVASWDLTPGSRWEPPEPVAPGEVAFVAPGRGTVRVDVPGVGWGQVPYEAAADGRRIPLTVRLDRPSRPR